MTTLEAIVTIIGGGIGGGGLVVLVREVLTWHRGRNTDQGAQERIARQDTRQEFQDLFNIQQKDLDKANAKIEALERREDRCQQELMVLWRRFERMSAWMLHHESEMKRAKIAFRPFNESSSDEHPKLEETV